VTAFLFFVRFEKTRTGCVIKHLTPMPKPSTKTGVKDRANLGSEEEICSPLGSIGVGKNFSKKRAFDWSEAEIWGRRSRRSGGLPPAPPLVGALLPYNPRKVVWVGVEWVASQTVRVVSLTLRSRTESTGGVRRRLQRRSPMDVSLTFSSDRYWQWLRRQGQTLKATARFTGLQVNQRHNAGAGW